MGYRSEVSIIVGKKVEKKIVSLRKKLVKDIASGKAEESALDNLDCILDTRQVSKDGQYTRYSHDYIKWYTDVDEPEYEGLRRLEELVKGCAAKFDAEVGEAASFIRIGEGDDDTEYADNWGGLQTIGIVVETEF